MTRIKRKLKLVSGWKRCYRWLSIKISMLGVVATSLWLLLPGLQQNIPNGLMTKVTLGLFILIGLGRIVDENKE